MPVRITGPARPVRDADHLHVLNRYDLLLAARADTSHGVLGEPPLNLRQGVLLCCVQRLGYLGMQGGSDGQALGGVDDHFREPGRPLPIQPREARPSHLLAGIGIDPVHPSRILVSGQHPTTHGLARSVEHRVLNPGAVRQVVVVSTRAVGLDIAQRISPGAPEQDHAALHRSHHQCF